MWILAPNSTTNLLNQNISVAIKNKAKHEKGVNNETINSSNFQNPTYKADESSEM